MTALTFCFYCLLFTKKFHNLVVYSLAIVAELLVKHLVWCRVAEVVKAMNVL